MSCRVVQRCIKALKACLKRVHHLIFIEMAVDEVLTGLQTSLSVVTERVCERIRWGRVSYSIH